MRAANEISIGAGAAAATATALTLDIGPNIKELLTPLVAALIPVLVAWRQHRKTRDQLQLTNLEFQRNSGSTMRDAVDRLEAGVRGLAVKAEQTNAALVELDRRKASEHVEFDRRLSNLELHADPLAPPPPP